MVNEPDMAPFDGVIEGERIAESLLPRETKLLTAWRKSLSEPWPPADLATLEQLSTAVDELWIAATRQRRELLAALNQPIPLSGQPPPPPSSRMKSAEECAEVATAHHSRPQAAARLTAAMVYWCALWFWPLSEAKELPTRAQWLSDLASLLLGDAGPSARIAAAQRVAERQRFHHREVRFSEVFEERGGFDVIVGNRST